ncbi:MAG TPA: ABC transporter transmembrane domain-containing protein [Chitinophagales bacterium]|nr:ABC transporter transmembrane domain-containing protein [Chitinophagales bacterium]
MNDTDSDYSASAGKKRRITLADLRKSSEIFRYTLPYKHDFIIGMLFLFLSSATVLAFPLIAGKLMDASIGKIEWVVEDLNTIAILLAALLLLQGIFSYGRVMFFAKVSEYSIADIRKALYSKIITMPIPFFEQRRVGELVSRITSDITQLQDTLSLSLAEFFRQITSIIGGTIIIFIKSPRLSLLMLATYPALIVMAMVFGRHIRRLSKQSQDALANANVVVEETFQTVNIVKAFTNELFEMSRFNRIVNSVVGLAMKAARYRAAFITFIIVGLIGGMLLVLWYGARLVYAGQMTAGDLVAFIVYTVIIGGSVGGMAEVYSKIQKTIGASESLMEIMREKPEITIEPDNEPLKKLRGEIRFENIRFAYPSRKDVTVLKNISFQIRSGEKIALAGPSGAGKSTIIQLLVGFHHPDAGTIYIDGRPVLDYRLRELRKNIGIVPQDVILFGGTIRENIAYGKTEAGEAEIIRAAEKANAMEFIRMFPKGLETVVGERGVKLSGGQKQRIAIARAILKDPSILVLDEATSSLDSASEILVQQALEELMRGRTSIIIAHRLSTIRKADRIFVLNKGELIEEGNHSELMKNEGGLYRHLIHLQFSQAETERA